MRGGSGEKIVQELILYAASAALSCLVLFVGLKQLDPNREAAKKALEQKKEIAKRLGRPLIQTNTYEVSIFLFIICRWASCELHHFFIILLIGILCKIFILAFCFV